MDLILAISTDEWILAALAAVAFGLGPVLAGHLVNNAVEEE